MKADTHAGFTGTHLELIAASENASRAVPPLWPLASSVAVNPFLGQTGHTLAQTSALLGRVAGLSVTMPRKWYADKLTAGTITDADLLDASTVTGCTLNPADLRAAALATDTTPTALPTVADLAATASGTDWPALIDDRIGAWAAGFFDKGQALWQATPSHGAFDSWRLFATRDLTAEINGLPGFAGFVASTAENPRIALAMACETLALGTDAAPTYFHQLLLGLGGWSQIARQHLWQAELAGKRDEMTSDMLAIRIIWEQALFARYKDQISAEWATIRAQHAAPITPSADDLALATLQEAADRAGQRALAQTLSGPAQTKLQTRPSLQAAFCIDVRSEVFRRALETLDPTIQTLGFAGFFGLTAAHNGFASDIAEQRLPVLLTAGVTSHATAPMADDQTARFAARAGRAWGRFKLAAVSSFAFVEATGPVYAGKLVRDALGYGAAPAMDTHKPQFDDSLALPDRINAATKILGAMSMTDNFAPLVLMVGHGANVVNNPHTSALHCGACGGYSGEVNARLLAGLLNDAAVRKGVAAAGITIPADTVFLGALHDTTTDAVTIFDTDTAQPIPSLPQAKGWLAQAGRIARTERALRLPRAASEGQVTKRSTDWAETRPEWALAGCKAFIAAPRAQTRGKSLSGQAFLHDYDWTADKAFGVLELILTAPVVVASWISLQYYGSVVAPDIFGAGNKLLHNVTGGIGVVEGNGGKLRAGLPWQSVHDGVGYAHDPLRLSVCIAAPQSAVTDILARHDGVRALFDNRWLHLFLLNDAGQMTGRYAGNLAWEDMPAALTKAAA
jgi:uncharacterized protein YbcC (UPF0753/DUF2309 family)